MLTQFFSNLFCPPEPGQVFVIAGKISDAAERVDIEFCTGKAESDNIILRISVRFAFDKIIRNARLEGKWGIDEILENKDSLSASNPFVSGEKFRVYILMSHDRFHIAINNMDFCTFQYRDRIEEIRTLKISKDIQNVNQVDQRRVYPVAFPIVHNNDDFLTFSNDVPFRFQPGHAIILTAIPYGNPKGRFVISFYERDTKKQAFHFNPRFESKVVVRNSTREDLSYREEERNGSFPFVFDQQFKLAIALTTNTFLVAVNGKQFCTYRYQTKEQLEVLNGFKLFCLDGMRLEISSVDHIYAGSPTARNFESFCDPDIELY